MKPGFVASGSPRDARAWSGIPHFALRELRRRGHDVTVIDTASLDRAIVALARALKAGPGRVQASRATLNSSR